MAEVKPTASAEPVSAERRSGTGFELRLERGGAYVRLADVTVEAGLTLDVLSIEVPGVKFPFNVGAGAVQFRHVLADGVRVELAVHEPWIEERLRGIDLAALGVEALSCALREGFVELSGRVAGGAAFTLHASLLPEGEQGIAVVFHSPRLYGPSPIPAALLPHMAARTLAPLASAPGGVNDPLTRILRKVLAPRGWKVPRSSALRLTLLGVSPDGIRAAWDREPGQPIEPPPQSDLLATIEGARAFATAERHLARGDLAAARDAYLFAGAAAHAHPFAAERLLSLLVMEDRFHDEALDLAHDWLGRRPDFAPALAAEAWVRLARGEQLKAAHALATLADTARVRGEGGAALAAAEACFSIAGADPGDVRRSMDAALAVRRDHLPALRALRANSPRPRATARGCSAPTAGSSPTPPPTPTRPAPTPSWACSCSRPIPLRRGSTSIRRCGSPPPTRKRCARWPAPAARPVSTSARSARVERLRDLVLARGDRAEAGRLSLEAGRHLGGAARQRQRTPTPRSGRPRRAPALRGAPRPRRSAARSGSGDWADASDHHASVIPLADTTTPEGRALVGPHAARPRRGRRERPRETPPPRPPTSRPPRPSSRATPPSFAVSPRIYRRLSRPADLLAALDRLAPLVEPAAERAALLAEAGDARRLARPPRRRPRPLLRRRRPRPDLPPRAGGVAAARRGGGRRARRARGAR